MELFWEEKNIFFLGQSKTADADILEYIDHHSSVAWVIKSETRDVIG